MPELPEVQTVLEGLQSVLKDRILTGVECYYPGTVIESAAISGCPFPARIGEFKRRGKYLLLHLESASSLIIHLRMTGKLVYEPNPEEPHKHERARITLQGGDAVRFIDPRTFGKIILTPSNSLAQYLPDLGPEPLGTEFTPQYLHKALQRKSMPIKNALLDQRIVAGLGNIYVCEILYRSGIRPDLPAGKISLTRLKLIVRHTREVLNESLAAGGTSVSDYRRIDDKSGEFQNFLRVYQKDTCPLGHSISNIRLGGRSSFYCPVCQK